MPRDVAVERPHPGIIGRELQHKVTTGLEKLRVSSLRILSIDCAVPLARAFSQDPEIVAVEMHGVGDTGALVADYQTDGAVGAEVVDVPLGVEGVGCVALICK